MLVKLAPSPWFTYMLVYISHSSIVESESFGPGPKFGTRAGVEKPCAGELSPTCWCCGSSSHLGNFSPCLARTNMSHTDDQSLPFGCWLSFSLYFCPSHTHIHPPIHPLALLGFKIQLSERSSPYSLEVHCCNFQGHFSKSHYSKLDIKFELTGLYLVPAGWSIQLTERTSGKVGTIQRSHETIHLYTYISLQTMQS